MFSQKRLPFPHASVSNCRTGWLIPNSSNSLRLISSRKMFSYLLNIAMNGNDKFRPYVAVCPDNYFFKIARCCFGLVFNYHPVKFLVVLRFPCKFHPNIFTRFRSYLCDPERVHGKDIHLFAELFSGFSIEADISPGYAHEFQNISHDTELHNPMNRIVCMHLYEVTQLSAAISGSIDFDR